jgi:hypothetical protein
VRRGLASGKRQAGRSETLLFMRSAVDDIRNVLFETYSLQCRGQSREC